jgi:hypothetical protein
MAKIINSRYDLNKSWSDDQDNFYSQSTANELRLWVRMDPSTPDDLGPYNLSPTYAVAPPINEVRLGNKLYPAATFNDAANSYAQVKDTSGRLCFTSLGDGETSPGGTDRPFSISLWVNLDNFDSTHYLFSKKGSGGGAPKEYWAYFSSTAAPLGRLSFGVTDVPHDGDSYLTMNTATPYTSAGSWQHFVFTYDGRGGTLAAAGLKIYQNGSLLETDQTNIRGPYVGMQPEYDTNLVIAATAAGGSQMDGQMAEFAVWGVELTVPEITAIYNVTRQKGMGGEAISGILNNPARTLLQDQDNATGSYPTVARTGDPDFTGRGSVLFDDTKTIEYFSSYATAEIEFSGRPRDADTFSLTGSTEASKRLFEFQRGVLRYYKSGVSGETVDSALVDITGRIQSPQSVAHAVAQTINSESIGIEATTLGPIVKLRQHTPVTGTYVQGNLISSSSRLSGRPIPIGVTQFKQHGPENYRYPMMLPIGSPHMSSSVATPNTLTTLQAPAIMGSNTSGVGITFTPGENLTPFNETRILIDNDDEFYAAGTPPSVLPGFDQRLSSKTSFSVDLTPTAETKVYFSTGANPAGGTHSTSAAGLAAGINSGLAYFNFADNKWEVIGDLTTGSNVDYISLESSNLTGSYLAVVPPRPQFQTYEETGSGFGVPDMRGVYKEKQGWVTGLPCQIAGFPVATKFDATGSQTLDMSNYITAPFLCEKIVLEISGAFGTPPTVDPSYYSDNISTYNPVPFPITFMLLNQFETDLENQVVKSTTRTDVSDTAWTKADIVHVTGSHFPIRRDKDIIWYGRYASFESVRTGNSTRHIPAGWSTEEDLRTAAPAFHAAADVWKPVAVSPHASTYVIYNPTITYTGSIKIEASARSVPSAPTAMALSPSRPWSGASKSSGLEDVEHVPLFGVETGGRNLFDLTSGRSYVGSTIGGKKVDKLFIGINTSTPSSNRTGMYSIPIYSAQERISPYLLMPSDKLILAVANQRYPLAGNIPVATGYSRATGYNAESPRPQTMLCPLLVGDQPAVQVDAVGPQLWSMTFTPNSSAKITFYGSLLRENKPVDFTLNQPLTSDAIHEDVRDDFSPYGEARCLDQFDVDPTTSFRGSYLDNIILGSKTILGPSNALRATATVTFTGVPPTNGTAITIVSTDETSKAYLKAASEDLGADPCKFTGTGAAAATSLKACIEDAEGGHNGKITVTVDGSGGMVLTQATAGATGNKTITNGLANTAATNFSGGADPINPRRVVTSVVDGQAGITGSLQRFVRMTDSSEVYYDSTVPNLKQLVDFLGTPFFTFNYDVPGFFNLLYYNLEYDSNAESGKWGSSTAYEHWQGGELLRQPTIKSTVRDPGSGGATIEVVRLGSPFGDYWTFEKSPVGGPVVTTLSLGGPEYVLKTIFGIGDTYGSPVDLSKSIPEQGSAGYINGDLLLLRGFKYGLINAVPTSPNAVFRYDTFGQFRDMLEPRPQSRFFEDSKLGEPAVTIAFYDRDGTPGVKPSSTNAQNLSLFATSSVPYSDMPTSTYGRDRSTVQPDLDPSEDLEITTS